MTEQELRDTFALNRDRGVIEIDDKTLESLMGRIVAYADARESKSANKVAEIRRLCKAFLYDLPCSHNVAVISDFLDAYADNKILDEFKKTVVAAKDTEIAELKAANKLSSSSWRKDCEERDDKITQLNAEINRLMDVAQRARQYCESGNGRGGATKLPSGEWFDEGEGTLYHALLSVLSPAPVTETQNEENQ